jgi:2-hydroxy-6-oxonona-2,4-dienedioate hydrolase
MSIDLIEEGKFRYVKVGEGKPLVLLHGLFGALSNFQDVIDGFSNEYQVVIPMLPIYELPLLKTNVKNISRFLEDFIEHMKFDKVILLGNSLGGHVGLVYSDNNPHKVDKLILTASSGLYENAFGGSFPRREDKSYLRDKISLTFYDPEMTTDELVDECHEAVNNRDKVIRILAIAKSAIRHNMEKNLPNFKMPTCLIWGRNDTITPPEVAKDFNKLIENSELFWIDKCGHAPMMEHPKEFNRILKEWLDKNK